MIYHADKEKPSKFMSSMDTHFQVILLFAVWSLMKHVRVVLLPACNHNRVTFQVRL